MRRLLLCVLAVCVLATPAFAKRKKKDACPWENQDGRVYLTKAYFFGAIRYTFLPKTDAGYPTELHLVFTQNTKEPLSQPIAFELTDGSKIELAMDPPQAARNRDVALTDLTETVYDVSVTAPASFVDSLAAAEGVSVVTFPLPGRTDTQKFKKKDAGDLPALAKCLIAGPPGATGASD
jgi:hypothetical protein